MNVIRFHPSANATAVALLAALLFALPLTAGAADAVAAERSRLGEERAAIEARYAARERECRDRFVVTSCIDDAKVERRRGIDALRARQLQLDEERRRARTAERRAELAAKAADDAKRDQERAARAASAPARREAPRPLEPRHESAAASASASSGMAHDRPGAKRDARTRAAAGEGATQRREREERHRASFDTRQRQASEHRQEVLEKAAQRLKARPPAAPLPVPASAPAR